MEHIMSFGTLNVPCTERSLYMETRYTVSRDGKSIEEFSPEDVSAHAREAFTRVFALNIAIGRIEEALEEAKGADVLYLNQYLRKYREELLLIRTKK
ncbi:MAG: hypothetical protein CMI56_01840 [Parcubacteria group bacterium]|nr:hypothetical protein [Parcubacteria group bacterium]|tara:strand:- start:23265 stop:23555 length:291 start_codon:yes stop_codon:yes gene_type:complete